LANGTIFIVAPPPMEANQDRTGGFVHVHR
jgi:hypothetical protein